MPFIVKCWIPVDADEHEVFDNLDDANSEQEHCAGMQSENIYEVVEVTDDGQEI